MNEEMDYVTHLQEQINDLQYELNKANAKHDALVQFLLRFLDDSGFDRKWGALVDLSDREEV